MTEADLGKAWAAMARQEGHKKALPEWRGNHMPSREVLERIETIRYLAEVEGLTAPQISKRINHSRSNIARICRDYGINIPHGKGFNPNPIPRGTIKQ